MSYRIASENEWHEVRSSIEDIGAAHKHAKRMLTGLGHVFNGKEPGGVAAMEFQPFPDGEHAVPIGNPYGVARFKSELVFSGVPTVILEVQRKRVDQFDREYWQTVQKIGIRANGTMFLAEPANSVGFSNLNASDQLFELGMQILYAIAVEPLAE